MTLTTTIIAAVFLAIIWAAALNYIPKNEHLYREYLAQSIPLYSTFNPREEDIIRENVFLAALHYLLGINVTQPTSILKTQIPVFNQFEYTQVISPIDPPVVDPPLTEEPIEPEPPPVPTDITLEGKRILIYHTHTTEAFVPSSGIPHTENFDETIVKVGEHLALTLKEKGAIVIHDKTHHSRRPYSDSYRRSRETVRKYLEEENFDLIIDLHRDGVGTSSDIGRPVTTTEINGVEMGRLLFVIGQRHDSWRTNYALSQKMFNIANNMYPTLARDTALKASGNYNQDLNEKMILIEIGGHWNTLEEAINTTALLANIIEKTIGD